MKITYRTEGDFRVPNIATNWEDVGRWGKERFQYMKENMQPSIDLMTLDGTLNAYLKKVNEEAEQMLESLTRELAKKEGVQEDWKNTDTLRWVGTMNNIKARAEEIVRHELIQA